MKVCGPRALAPRLGDRRLPGGRRTRGRRAAIRIRPSSRAARRAGRRSSEPGSTSSSPTGSRRRACASRPIWPPPSRDAEVVWVTFDTPVDDDDRADVDVVVDADRRGCFRISRDGALVLVSSQLPVGTTRRLEQRGRRGGPRPPAVVRAALRRTCGSARPSTSFTQPDRVVVGVRDDADARRCGRAVRADHRSHRVDVGRVGGDDQARAQRVPGARR